jgi:hypothetical protein
MRVKINRDVCPAHLAFCERCLGKFLNEPLGYERRCFETLEEDDSEILTIDLHTGDKNVVFELTPEERELVAAEGWTYFVDFNVPMYRNNVEQDG